VQGSRKLGAGGACSNCPGAAESRMLLRAKVRKSDKKTKEKRAFLLHFSRFFVTLPFEKGEVTPSWQKKEQVLLFCSRLFVTLQA
jgi:hypothetical protein